MTENSTEASKKWGINSKMNAYALTIVATVGAVWISGFLGRFGEGAKDADYQPWSPNMLHWLVLVLAAGLLAAVVTNTCVARRKNMNVVYTRHRDTAFAIVTSIDVGVLFAESLPWWAYLVAGLVGIALVVWAALVKR